VLSNKTQILSGPDYREADKPICGYLTIGCQLLEGKIEFADAWNFGPNHENNVTVLELVKEVQKHWER
jgi:CDP-glucose 4,6-dehydratase